MNIIKKFTSLFIKTPHKIIYFLVGDYILRRNQHSFNNLIEYVNLKYYSNFTHISSFYEIISLIINIEDISYKGYIDGEANIFSSANIYAGIFLIYSATYLNQRNLFSEKNFNSIFTTAERDCYILSESRTKIIRTNPSLYWDKAASLVEAQELYLTSEGLKDKKLDAMIVIDKNIHKPPVLFDQVMFDSLNKFKIFSELKKYKIIKVFVRNKVPAGITLQEAYKHWNIGCFQKVLTPFNLPRRIAADKTCDNLLLIEMHCMKLQNASTMRSCYFGYNGYILCILFDIKNNIIWDARGELT